MNTDDIQTLASSGLYRGSRLRGRIEETHISWVILSGKFAFKIKKPVKLSFLDFSTLAKRKHYCEQEQELNSRFSRIYLKVVPVRHDQGTWRLGTGRGKVLDYAVQMQRLDSPKRMDKMLRKGRVTRRNIHALAVEVAHFHRQSQIIRAPFDLRQAQGLFNDIRSEAGFIQEHLGVKYAAIIRKSIDWSDAFLKEHEARIRQRIRLGFRRDVHGDLHSGNIFLYKKPVLFDCIEFSDNIRRIDVIHDTAFFCMDLEAFGKKALAEAFLKEYNRLFPCILTPEDERLFTYYKCCRANVRAKVHASSARLADADAHLQAVRRYLDLMEGYMGGFW